MILIKLKIHLDVVSFDNIMDLFESLASEGRFNVQLTHQFQSEYGENFLKALEYLQKDAKKIVKYHFFPSNHEIWIVPSLEKENQHYIIYPDIFCQCTNFEMDFIYRKKKFGVCKHLLAQKLVNALNLYQTEELKDNDWPKLKKSFKY